MTFDQARHLVAQCAGEMNLRYKKTVFDEWAIVQFRNGKGYLLSYSGPRKQGFQENFLQDAAPLRGALWGRSHQPGEFEFTRQSAGTAFEAFMALGEGMYLICNNTVQSMDDIARDPFWLSAQVPFAGISEAVRQSPVCRP